MHPHQPSRTIPCPRLIQVGLLIFVSLPLAAAETHQHSSCPLAQSHGGEEEAAEGSRALQELGQAAFAAVAEMVAHLEADPSVDWSSVRLDRLREHLADMDRVMTTAQVDVSDLDDGFRARVTSADARTADAIGRMLPAHGRMMDGHRGWSVRVEPLSGPERGVILQVRSDDPAQATKLRALGFAGFLVADDHHRPHHLAMTLGRGH